MFDPTCLYAVNSSEGASILPSLSSLAQPKREWLMHENINSSNNNENRQQNEAFNAYGCTNEASSVHVATVDVIQSNGTIRKGNYHILHADEECVIQLITVFLGQKSCSRRTQNCYKLHVG